MRPYTKRILRHIPLPLVEELNTVYEEFKFLAVVFSHFRWKYTTITY